MERLSIISSRTLKSGFRLFPICAISPKLNTIPNTCSGDYFLIAIDGSGQLVFDKKHCDHCLHRTDKNGKKIYFHPVLEAKLVAANGFVFSVATEFIENPAGDYEKQDCELKAFYRLEKTLKARFPRTPLCLLLDAIYAGKPVFDICRTNHWKFFITFKEGSMPALYQET